MPSDGDWLAQRGCDRRRPALDLDPVAVVALGNEAVDRAIESTPSRVRDSAIECTSEYFVTALADQLLELRDFFGIGLWLLNGIANGTAAEQPYRASSQSRCVASDELTRWLEPVAGMDRAADDDGIERWVNVVEMFDVGERRLDVLAAQSVGNAPCNSFRRAVVRRVGNQNTHIASPPDATFVPRQRRDEGRWMRTG